MLINNLGPLIRVAALKTPVTSRLLLPPPPTHRALLGFWCHRLFIAISKMYCSPTISVLKSVVLYFLSRKRRKCFTKLWAITDAKDLRKWTDEFEMEDMAGFSF